MKRKKAAASARNSAENPRRTARETRGLLAAFSAFLVALALPVRASGRVASMASLAVVAVTMLVGAEARVPGAATVFSESLSETTCFRVGPADEAPERAWSEEAWPLEVDFEAIDSDADDDLVPDGLAPRASRLDVECAVPAVAGLPAAERAVDSSRYALEPGLPRGPPTRGC